MRTSTLTIRAIVILVATGSFISASAATVPFTENFTTDSANWRDSTSVTPLSWSNSGGPDGGSYASASFNFASLVAGNTPAVIRAQDEFNSSNGAFEGDWVAGGINSFSMKVRHNAPEPMSYFVRFSSPANFPGMIAVSFTPVAPSTWTDISFDIVEGNPALFGEGFSFNDVFSNIGHVQVGVTVSATLAGVDQSFDFDIDQVSIVPEPGALGLIALGALAFLRRR